MQGEICHNYPITICGWLNQYLSRELQERLRLAGLVLHELLNSEVIDYF
jgi:hypothetical protein